MARSRRPHSMGSRSIPPYGLSNRSPSRGPGSRHTAWRAGISCCLLLAAAAVVYVMLTGESRSPGYSLAILSPIADATVPSGPTVVSVELREDGKLVDPSMPGSAQSLHLHYYLDAEPPTAPGHPALTASTTCFSSPSTSHTWNLVGSGKHRLFVQLVQSNDIPLSPPVIASVAVVVPASVPASLPPAAPRKTNPGGGS